MKQKELIHEEDWDVLLILDACRYDYFEKTYEEYLSGNLMKVRSEGSGTQPWLRNTFTGMMEDVIYISSTAMVNSLRVDLINFNAKNHFWKIVDFWEEGWNKELWTVPPKGLTKKSLMIRAKYPDKRLIIHYLQPHDPYLSYGPVRNEVSADRRRLQNNYNLKNSLFHSIKMTIKNFLFRSKNPIEKFVEKYGEDELRLAYKDNLEKVLKEVKKLISKLPDKNIIITADHGELLGENEKYRHPTNSNNPILLNVPWFIVN